MSLIPCDGCRLRPPEKLSQVTWAWYSADGERTAYRKRLCTACFCSKVLPLDKVVDYDALTCPACGISTEHDMDPCYVTAYIPGQGKYQLEMPLCPVHAIEVHVYAAEGGAKLENRERVEGLEPGPSTVATRESYWSSIGVRPRGLDE
jgi:ribosomal protein S27AE